MNRRTILIFYCLVLSSLVFLLAACGTLAPAPAAETDTPTVQPFTSTATLVPTETPTPSPTPEPLAAMVNGEPITLVEFQAELARFQAARQALPGAPLAPDVDLSTDAGVQAFVLDELINQRLFAQAAYAAGFILTPETLQARQDQISAELGGAQALQDYLAANQYTPQAFQAALARSIAATWMRDQVLASTPTTAEQIHARQILLYNQDQADQILAQLRSGKDFTTLAYQYDPVAGGDLGWFPRGYLLEPAIEEAAFKLQPGAYTEVISTRLGYHILFVIAREPDHLLDPDPLLVVQRQALQTWLLDQKSNATIQLLLP